MRRDSTSDLSSISTKPNVKKKNYLFLRKMEKAVRKKSNRKPRRKQEMSIFTLPKMIITSTIH